MLGGAFAPALADAQRGEERAFATLWRDVNPVVVRYLRVTAPGVADDLASETWLQVVRDLARFEGDERAFRGWVLRIARNRAIDWSRAQARRPVLPVELDSLADLPATDDTAALALESLTTATALDLIRSLPAAEAEVVTLRVIAGLDVGAIAALVGKRPGAVRVATHRGLRRLAEALAKAEPTAKTPARVTRRSR